MSTHDDVGPEKSLSKCEDIQRERQLPLVFFSILLALWVAAWYGLYLLV